MNCISIPSNEFRPTTPARKNGRCWSLLGIPAFRIEQLQCRSRRPPRVNAQLDSDSGFAYKDEVFVNFAVLLSSSTTTSNNFLHYMVHLTMSSILSTSSLSLAGLELLPISTASTLASSYLVTPNVIDDTDITNSYQPKQSPSATPRPQSPCNFGTGCTAALAPPPRPRRSSRRPQPAHLETSEPAILRGGLAGLGIGIGHVEYHVTCHSHPQVMSPAIDDIEQPDDDDLVRTPIVVPPTPDERWEPGSCSPGEDLWMTAPSLSTTSTSCFGGSETLTSRNLSQSDPILGAVGAPRLPSIERFLSEQLYH
ncbi:hypothetical protein OBBRIDRAFT_883891 [Obba rivulosa]|uniref:Uncharacterized protein n=1 Tax=Obba rivulosa TaxID=1052685 RepID=A0A8E2DU06_9APHY|nr:hypothetical protein OBBRIDRAFT_883891 [Obba rivulosa]